MTVKEIQNVRVRGVDTVKYHNEKESLMKSKIAKIRIIFILLYIPIRFCWWEENVTREDIPAIQTVKDRKNKMDEGIVIN